ncbi:TPA: hypothetical protein EYP26_05700 [Candidatus Bathyarchaeota archaeon]|nr:hypothetical protein [Candidatus Bathyarchaeota archaeon]
MLKWYHYLGLGIASIWLASRLIQLYEYMTGIYAFFWHFFTPFMKFVDPIVTATETLFAPALLIILILIHKK